MSTESNLTTGFSPAAARSESSSLREWLSVLAVALGSFAFVTTEFLPVGLLPLIANTLHVSPGTAGLTVTMPGIFAAISAPGLMIVAGQMDRRRVFLLLTALLLAANLLSAFAPNFALMLIGRALFGAGIGGFWTLATASAARLVRPRDGARAIAAILAGVTLATVLGVPIGTFIAGFASWRCSFVATSALVAVAFIAQWWLVPSLPSTAGLRPADLVELMKRPHARRGFLLMALLFFAHFGTYTYITPFLLRNASFGMGSITWMLFGFGALGFIANYVASSTVDRHMKATTTVMGSLLMLALLLLPLLQHSRLLVIVDVMVWGVAFGALPLCSSVWTQRATPDLPEAASALYICSIEAAIGLGSLVGGLVVDRAGISANLLLGAGMALLGLVVLASFWRNGER
jgi:predicted MFS family arabinose efflux permease